MAGHRTGWGRLRLLRGRGGFLAGVAAEQRGQRDEEHAGGQKRVTHGAIYITASTACLK